MKRILRFMLLDYLFPRRRRTVPAAAKANRGNWTFFAGCGSSRVTVSVRKDDGTLIYSETMTAAELDGLLSVARSILQIADSGTEQEPTEPRRSFPRLLND